jgi:C-terminal processing protease CtpA/Prc
MPLVRNTKGLILDLRQYPVEFIRIADYLSDRKLRFSILSKAEFKSPGYFTRYGFPFGTSRVGKWRGNRNDYPGKVVVLINEYSASSAEFHAMAFRPIPGVVLVGSNTPRAGRTDRKGRGDHRRQVVRCSNAFRFSSRERRHRKLLCYLCDRK